MNRIFLDAMRPCACIYRSLQSVESGLSYHTDGGAGPIVRIYEYDMYHQRRRSFSLTFSVVRTFTEFGTSFAGVDRFLGCIWPTPHR